MSKHQYHEKVVATLLLASLNYIVLTGFQYKMKFISILKSVNICDSVKANACLRDSIQLELCTVFLTCIGSTNQLD
jgi:hypothetical protein